MKTLINNRDKRIRITAPKIEFKPKYINGLCWDYDAYEIGREMTVYAKDWTLVEEEPKHTEVWVEGRIIFEQDAKKPEVDLEKEIKKHTDLFQADIEYPLRLTAIKFYELGRKGGSK